MRSLLLASLSLPLLAQQPAAPFQTHQLSSNVYWVEGGGGNSGVVIGDKGVLVIDAKTTEAGGKELLESIAKITPKPVTTVIETHSDGDHVNGIAAFPASVTVIAHENNKKEQDTALSAGGRGAPPAGQLPTHLVTKNHETYRFEGLTLELYHWAPAHTSGDLVVFPPSEHVVFTGDIIATQMADPLIHLEKNGSSAGWIETVKGMLALDATQYVPGHGNVQDKGAVEKRLADATAKRAKIQQMVSQGKSLEEIKAAVDPQSAAPSAAPAGRGGGRGGFASYTDVVYRELTTKG